MRIDVLLMRKDYRALSLTCTADVGSLCFSTLDYQTMERPVFEDIKSGKEFNSWYWLKKEMVDICKKAGLPSHGRKFEIRDRIMYAIDHNGEIKPELSKPKPKSKFNWAKSELTLETKITDNISFGPNFRRFMERHIGDQFYCHTDFMEWVKSNEGKCLQDAVDRWNELELRKKDPNFSRKIADNNMYNQYTRDFLKDHPNKTIKDARTYWLRKKLLPMKDGFVKYEPSDLKLQ